jgi:hypothetical protein
MEKINDTINKAKKEVKDLIKKAHDKQLEAQPGRTMMESFENEVNKVVVCLIAFILFVFQFNKSNLPLS